MMMQVLNALKMLFAPYVPFSSQRLHELLGFTGDVMAVGWRAQPVPGGAGAAPPTPLFARVGPVPGAQGDASTGGPT